MHAQTLYTQLDIQIHEHTYNHNIIIINISWESKHPEGAGRTCHISPMPGKTNILSFKY